jgi:hypothetical protein
MNRKIPVLISITVIALITGFLAKLKTCSSSHDSYGIEIKPAISNNGKYAVAVMSATTTTSYSENGGYRKSDYSTVYYLNLYETATGKLIRQKKIISTRELKDKALVSYGGFNDKLWLFANELKAFDANTGEEVTNDNKLAGLNVFLKENFIDAPNAVTGNAAQGFIDFTDADREQHRVDLNNLTITPLKEIPTADRPRNEDYLRSVFNREESFGSNCDTFNGRIYTLAKDSMEVLSFNPDHKMTNEGSKKVNLYSSAFQVKNFNGHTIYNYPDVKALPGTSYLNGNFLNTHSNTVIHTEDPVGYLIVHQDSFSNTAKTILTRVDLKHNKIWDANTGISTKLLGCIVKNNYCILTGRISYNISLPAGSDGFCIINLKTGEIIKPSIH